MSFRGTAEPVSAGTPAIFLRAISKRFGGNVALRGVDLDIRRGEAHALLGQNGAGKSTLMKILTGLHPAGSFDGEILLEGRAVRLSSPAEAARQGVGYVPQEIQVIDRLNVAENIFAGRTGLGRRLVGRRRLRDAAGELLARHGMIVDAAAPAGGLPTGQQHLVMIARALARDPRVLMLDEPTASFSDVEVGALTQMLRRLRDRGTTIVYISHRLSEIMAICDRATILADGRVAETVERVDFDRDRFVAAMTGKAAQRLYPTPPVPPHGAPLLTVTDLSVASRPGQPAVRGVSLSVRAGEIVGLAGLLGSGRTEILQAIYGHVTGTGMIEVAGRQVSIRSPADARRHGMVLLTEDRKRSGLLFNLPVRANVTIGNLREVSRAGQISRAREGADVERFRTDLGIVAPSLEAAVTHLSGGNQQKLLFARALMARPRILLLDEPTKGVDPATRRDIYDIVMRLAAAGTAILVVASELEEVIGLSHRCLVIADGRVVDAFDRGDGDERRVLHASAQAHAATLAAAA